MSETKVLDFTTPAHDDEERIEADLLKVLRSREYVAFQSLRGRGRLRPRLLLVPRRGPWEWLSNAALWRIRAEPDGSNIGLSFHTAGVLVAGRGLLSASLAVDAHHCLFLQEHDPERHGPLAPGQPAITSIQFFDPKGSPGEAEPAARAGRPTH